MTSGYDLRSLYTKITEEEPQPHIIVITFVVRTVTDNCKDRCGAVSTIVLARTWCLLASSSDYGVGVWWHGSDNNH
jgi:hypothetical protein